MEAKIAYLELKFNQRSYSWSLKEEVRDENGG